MKLLFDEHLSRKLVTRLADIYPSASHMIFHGLEHTEDTAIWNFAAAQEYIIVTKDADFNDLAALHGPPPRVIWLQVGNCTTATIEEILRRNVLVIEQFINDPKSSVLKII
jgi:predicted nuclease of predicted toxin-antitoxin system